MYLRSRWYSGFHKTLLIVIQAEVGEVKLEVAEAEVRAESNMLRAAQLVEELREEQGNASRAETEKKEVEVGEDENISCIHRFFDQAKVRELQQHVEEEEAGAIKWGDKMVRETLLG